MRYMMFYKPDPARQKAPTREHMAAMGDFIEQMIKAGKLLATDGLKTPSTHDARVQHRNGDFTVTDGPFSEAKEVIAGYAVVQCGSRDEAIALAKRFLSVAGDGVSEIHPIFEPEDFAGTITPEEIARERAWRDELSHNTGR